MRFRKTTAGSCPRKDPDPREQPIAGAGAGGGDRSALPDWARDFASSTSAAGVGAARFASREAPPVAAIADHDAGAPRLLTVAETAARLSVSAKTIRRLIGRGELRAVRVGHVVRVDAREIERLLEA